MMGGCYSRFKEHTEDKYDRFPVDVLREMHTKRCPLIWVLGGPCSGKTIHCSRLARRYNLYHINFDHLLRDELSKMIQMNTGGLVDAEDGKLMLLSREFLIGLIQQEIQTNCFTTRGFLLEGYPRSITQSEELIKEVGPPSIIFYFHASLHSMKKRLRHERPFFIHSGLGEEASYLKIYSFVKFFYPILLKYHDKTVRMDTDGDIDTIFQHVAEICKDFLKRKHIHVPLRAPVI